MPAFCANAATMRVGYVCLLLPLEQFVELLIGTWIVGVQALRIFEVSFGLSLISQLGQHLAQPELPSSKLSGLAIKPFRNGSTAPL